MTAQRRPRTHNGIVVSHGLQLQTPMEDPHCSCKLTNEAGPQEGGSDDEAGDCDSDEEMTDAARAKLLMRQPLPKKNELLRCGTPQHGPSSKKMALITSDYGIMCSLRI